MVSRRCKMAVEQALMRMGLQYIRVDLGMAELREDITEEQKARLKRLLHETGLELIEDKKDRVVEQIKTTVIESIYYCGTPLKVPFSAYLSRKLNLNYTYLSNLFTASQGITITHFMISHKIERVKELIEYNELTFSEIAFKMHYSSIGHLSNQFKKMTGTTLSFYKTHGQKRDINIENL